MIRWLFIAALAAVPMTSSARSKANSIEARLQRAEDELAIRRIPVAYARALDERNFDAYVALFAKNGEWINGPQHRKGREDIRQLLIGIFGNAQPGAVNRSSMEITTNIDVEIHGDRATSHSQHLLLRRGPDGSPTPVLAGRYEDQLIREDGQWKILRRIDTPVLPTDEEWEKIMHNPPKAR